MAVEHSVLQSHSLRHDGAYPGAISRKGSVMGLPGGGFQGAFANGTFSAELSCEGECEKKEASGHRAVC